MRGDLPVQSSTTFDSFAGVGTLASVQNAWTNRQLCEQGHHAWVPWLHLDNGSIVTWCAREGCDHREQYDADV